MHAADLHLDTPFKGIGEVAPDVASALREASLEAFDAIIDLALERRAAFLLVAGDVYDGAARGLRAQLRFRHGLARLAEAGIQSFVVHGNHDPVATGWSAVERWPEAVTVFGCEDVRAVPVERDGTLLATVQGLSYATSATTENLALRLARPSGPGLHVGLLHCNVEGAATGHANYSPCTLDDLRRTGLDYLALGHVHQRRVLAGEVGRREPFVVYPGNSQARSPRPSELEPKGAYVVQVRDGVVTELDFVACDRVRFAVLECDVAGLHDLGELTERLVESGREHLEAAEGRSLVLRARLTGRGPLHGDLARPGIVGQLLETLRAEPSGRATFCWWDDLLDETRPTLERAALRDRGDFAADLVALADSYLVSAARAEALLGELERPPRALERALAAALAEGDGALGLLDEAADLALGELMGEGR